MSLESRVDQKASALPTESFNGFATASPQYYFSYCIDLIMLYRFVTVGVLISGCLDKRIESSIETLIYVRSRVIVVSQQKGKFKIWKYLYVVIT
mgnify:CR=1 FL=1